MYFFFCAVNKITLALFLFNLINSNLLFRCISVKFKRKVKKKNSIQCIDVSLLNFINALRKYSETGTIFENTKIIERKTSENDSYEMFRNILETKKKN